LKVNEERPDHALAAAMRNEVAGWEPPHGPDISDLVSRADRSWRRPVLFASSLGATALALVLLLSVLMLALAPAIPGGEAIRQHLAAP
jgi:hypothetical protein